MATAGYDENIWVMSMENQKKRKLQIGIAIAVLSAVALLLLVLVVVLMKGNAAGDRTVTEIAVDQTGEDEFDVTDNEDEEAGRFDVTGGGDEETDDQNGKSRSGAAGGGDEEADDQTGDGEDEWSVDRLKAGFETAIQYDKQYKAYISSREEAERKIREYGEQQRELYSNPEVTEIEKQMEQDYGLFAVNLGEMDVETARDIERAFAYMYREYPMLQGTLTNVSLGNLNGFTNGKIAITQVNEFIINEEFGVCPHVVKHEIILAASSFLNRDNFLKNCEQMAESGHWPEHTDISSVVVHELGHQLLNAYAMQQFGLQDPYYITEENEDAYSAYLTDSLSSYQEIPKQVLNEAYERWESEHPGEDYTTFCKEISEYAVGVQTDGGISYPETFAEAIADVYLHGEDAADASRKIDEVIRE